MKSFSLSLNFMLSLFAGAITTLVIGAILFPLIVLLYESLLTGRTIDSRFWNTFNRNDLVFTLSVFAWLFIAAMAGGFTCTLISKTNANIQLLILIIDVLILISVYIKPTPGSVLIFISLTVICTAGYFTGDKIASAIKMRRLRQPR